MPTIGGQGAHAGEVGPSPVDRIEIELEVARVEDDPLRREEGGGERVRHRVGDRNELDLTGPDLPPLAVDRRG